MQFCPKRVRLRLKCRAQAGRSGTNRAVMMVVLLFMATALSSRNVAGQSTLFETVYAADVELLDSLLQAGADVNARDASGMTLLHFAAIAGYIEIARVLLRHGADIDARDLNGRTPLYGARGPMACFLEAQGASGARPPDVVADLEVDSTHIVHKGTELRAGVATGDDVVELLGLPAALESRGEGEPAILEFDLLGEQVLVVWIESVKITPQTDLRAHVTSFHVVGRCEERGPRAGQAQRNKRMQQTARFD